MEQGGCASDKIYCLVNNEQLVTAQQSELGIDLGLVSTGSQSGVLRQVISAAGFADDVGLLASSMQKLKVLLHLTMMYCDKYQVKLVWMKTKLLVFTSRQTETQARLQVVLTRLAIDGPTITPTFQANHSGSGLG